MWWLWVVGVLVAWLAVAAFVGVVLGRGIHLADRRSPGTGVEPLPAQPAAAARPLQAPARRRAIPLPPVGIALAALAVALMTTGYALRLSGSTGTAARLFSMDAANSVPRLFITLLFAAAATAAVVGAGILPGRRTWWLAVGAVAGGITAVKAGSTVHADAMQNLQSAVGAGGAVTVSAVAALVVVAGLFWLSRTERRDRRRVLGVLSLYAVASVGLSAVSTVAAQAYGSASTLAVGATFVEESGEALAGVAFLVAVLVGVAPQLVLPAGWALRRADDQAALEAAQQLSAVGRAPGR